jgi:anti-sigma factor ChrR (cupin superfamily)
MTAHQSITDELRELASGYAMGLLGTPETNEFENHLSNCYVCRTEVKALQRIHAALAATAPPVEPPPHIREELLRKIALQPRVVRAEAGTWEKTPFRGVEVRQLFDDKLTGSVTTLLRAAPGAVYPAHCHGGLEHVYVIDGDLVFDDHTLQTGDYEVSEGSSRHSSITSRTGCLALIIHHVGDEILPEPPG